MVGLMPNAGVVGARFSPALLFLGGAGGAYFDPSNSATVWQDAAATTPAVADDPVGRIDDLSGNGNHASTSTDAERPILRNAGGLWYLEFDGVDDWLQLNAILTGTLPHTVVAGVRNTEAVTPEQSYFGVGLASTGLMRQFTTEVGLRVAGGNKLFADTNVNTDMVVTQGLPDLVTPNATDALAWKNGAAMTSTGEGSQDINTATNEARLGRGADTGTGQDPYQGRIYALVAIDEDLADADRQATESWVAARTGVSM